MSEVTLAPGQVWTPTRPGSRAKARFIMGYATNDQQVASVLYAPGWQSETVWSRGEWNAWVERHAATCEEGR